MPFSLQADALLLATRRASLYSKKYVCNQVAEKKTLISISFLYFCAGIKKDMNWRIGHKASWCMTTLAVLFMLISGIFPHHHHTNTPQPCTATCQHHLPYSQCEGGNCPAHSTYLITQQNVLVQKHIQKQEPQQLWSALLALYAILFITSVQSVPRAAQTDRLERRTPFTFGLRAPPAFFLR